MALVLPNPGSPANGQPLDANPILANQTAIAQSIQSFDGTQIQAGTLTSASAFNTALNPVTRTNETISPFVASGCTWSIVSGLQGTMAGGVVYINGIRIISTGVGSNVFTASQDTYVAIDVNANITYSAVANGAASPALPANSIWLAKVITSASVITSIVQSGVTSLNASIRPYGATSTSSIDFNSFALNMKSALNTSVPTLTNTSQDLASSGLTLSFTVATVCSAFVTVSLGVGSGSDFEFQPQIRVDGTVVATLSPSAGIATTNSRSQVRGFTYVVSLSAGTHTISAGVNLASGSVYVFQVGSGSVSALVLGKVTA